MEKSIDNKNSGSFWNEFFTYQNLKQLEEEYGSSFYVLDIERLRENYKNFAEAFKSRYSNVILGYSYKTNYLPYMCKELSKMGAYAEVVSRLEYDLALKLGQNPLKIIFNGPLKTREDIQFAIQNKSIINVDSNYEINFIKDYAKKYPNKEIKIGLRLNFDLSLNGESPLQEGYEVSRFGICVENGNLLTVLLELQTIENINVVGLHGHFSTRDRSTETYAKITGELCKIAKNGMFPYLKYIDVGGGFYGELPNSFSKVVPTFDDYAEVICQIMNNEFGEYEEKPILVLEPGISLVANTFYFIGKVIETKTVRDKKFVLVDGSVHNIKPTMHNYNLPMRIVRQMHSSSREQVFNIVGYTCMEKDYLAHDVQEILPQIDDYIVFENVGAYTIVLNPPFIKERPAIIATEHNEVTMVRKKETLKQFFNEDIYCF